MSKYLFFEVGDNIGNIDVSNYKFGDTDIFKEENELLLMCCAYIPNKFWEREKHFVSLPYKEGWSMSHETTLYPRMPHDEELRK